MPDKLKGWLALPNLKDFFAVIREAFLLIIVALLLLKPAWINLILVNAGITSVSAMGLTWQEKAVAAQKIAETSQMIATAAPKHLGTLHEKLGVYSAALTANGATNSQEVLDVNTKIDS